jgi:threonine dehydratase
VICGGNIDVRLLASVLMRGLVRDGRLVRLRIDITDQPGVLARVAGLIGRCGGNIVEVYHQRLFHDVPVKRAEVDAVIETRNREHVMEIVDALKDGGFATRILSTLSSDGPTQA